MPLGSLPLQPQQYMKRALLWQDDEDEEASSSDESSGLDSSKDNDEASTKNGAKTKKVESTKRKKRIDFEALRRHGYKGGPSVLSMPLPKEPIDGKQDWSWSSGKETREKEIEETYAERQKTRVAIVEGEQLTSVQTQKEKNLSFSQREKKKRELGQSSRGKNYVEEEKRLLRERGIYSGFDS